ncbi:OmpP1/FadL family transporter [Planctomicrobium piriforme]|uniref:Long-chain fatty acid transport protein n=1 Tax=Planctomicrobium piriforme TaxID=1576369 RepID=A0A1I3H2R1_9PLAN|nr:outer membrane protein transport protein [Planctomicrobium piriforme]SFI29943.1 Long-chain fatty acid transport protein [Planctomicrobium piriforme]
MGRSPAVLLAFSLLLLTVRGAVADGIILNGVSPRSIGRGGTNIAHSDNGGLIFDNPAGIAAVQGNGLFDIGVDTLITDFSYSDPANATSYANSATPLPQISLVRKSEDGRWAYGIGLFTPAGFSESYRLEGPPPLGGPQLYESFGALMKILPALAWQPTEGLRFGGTLGVGINHTELQAPYFLQDPTPYQGLPMLLDMQGSGAALVWSVGMQYDVTEATTLGVTYQSASDFHLSGPASVTVPGLGTSRYDASMNIVFPQSVGWGVKHKLAKRHTLSTDLIWYDWSTAFDELSLSFSNPSTPGFPPVAEHVPLNWRDSLSVRLGYEWDLETMGIVRFGYVYHRNPIPDNTLTPLIQATMQNGFSTGYGFQFKNWDLDLAYMFMFGPRQNVSNSVFIGNDFDGSSTTAQTHAIAVSAIRRF